MNNTKITKVNPLVETKFMGLYDIEYKNKQNTDRNWTVASRKNKKQGAGIGLALSKEIVEKHHGFISAYNDNGAVFDLSFPLLDIKEKVI